MGVFRFPPSPGCCNICLQCADVSNEGGLEVQIDWAGETFLASFSGGGKQSGFLGLTDNLVQVCSYIAGLPPAFADTGDPTWNIQGAWTLGDDPWTLQDPFRCAAQMIEVDIALDLVTKQLFVAFSLPVDGITPPLYAGFPLTSYTGDYDPWYIDPSPVYGELTRTGDGVCDNATGLLTPVAGRALFVPLSSTWDPWPPAWTPGDFGGGSFPIYAQIYNIEAQFNAITLPAGAIQITLKKT